VVLPPLIVVFVDVDPPFMVVFVVLPPLIVVFVFVDPLIVAVPLVLASAAAPAPYRLPPPITPSPNSNPRIIPASASNPSKAQQAGPQNPLGLTTSST